MNLYSAKTIEEYSKALYITMTMICYAMIKSKKKMKFENSKLN